MKRNSRFVALGLATTLCGGALALATHAQQGRATEAGRPAGVPGASYRSYDPLGKPAGVPNGGYAGYDPSRPITVNVIPGGLQADLRNGAIMNTVMDAATLKVTVSPAMTTFSDAKGHSWTLYAGKRQAAPAR